MPEEKTIHDLPIAEQTNASDVFETEIPSSLMQSGYASRKVTMSSLETHMLGTEQYETQLPNFPQGSRSVFTALEYARQSGGGGGASVIQKTMAEYTALPTSEKMNGSIYKITDKALICCLDEEFHALKEITSADYAQLTPAEQNNGTLYILTDEETTAADIPYSSGVSVADKIDDMTTYSTSEKVVGTWINGKPIYQKTVSIGALPNNTTTGYEVVGEAIETLVDISVIATDTTGNYFIVLPNLSSNQVFQISFDVEIDNGKTKVFIVTARDVTGYSGVVTIRYTKR